MSKEVSFDFDWLPGEYGDSADRYTAASLSLWVTGVNVTELEDLRAKTVRQGMRASANTLALWLAGNWWRLRWEPERLSVADWRMSHCMAAAGGGHAWPDITYCSDGSEISVKTKLSHSDDFPVRYLREINAQIKSGDFEKGVDHFIDSVVVRLMECGVHDAELIQLWHEVQQERNDSSLSAYRKMEALLGFDADEAPDALMGQLDGLSRQFGRGSVEEMVAAYGSDAVNEISTLESEGKVCAQSITVPATEKIRVGVQRRCYSTSKLQPWELAGIVARETRSEWGFEPDEPISTQAFANAIEVAPSLLEGTNSIASNPSMSVGFRSGTSTESISIILDRKPITSRRFALARVIGDNFYSQEEDNILPATAAKTVRQKFQRAFAQEFLCPFGSLEAVIGEHRQDEDAIEDAAAMFGVSPLLVKMTLVNKGVLDRAYLS